MSILIQDKELYKRLLSYISPYKRKVIIIIIAMVFVAVTQPMMAALMEPLLNGVFISKDKSYIFTVPLLILAVFVVRGISEYIVAVMSETVSQKTIATLRQEMYSKLHKMPMSDYFLQTTGSLISKVSYDVSQVSRALTEAWIILIRDSLVIIGLLSLMIYYSWILTLSIMLLAPIAYIIIEKASKKMRIRSIALQKNMGELTHALEEGIGGSREIRVYNAQKYENERFAYSSNNVASNAIKIKKITALIVPLVQIIGAIALVIVLYLATFLSEQNTLSVGEFVAYITAMLLLFEPIKELTNVNPEIQKGLAAAQSIFTMIDSPLEEDKGNQELQNVKGQIDFNSIDFSFDQDLPFFSNFSLSIKAKETVALVGESGSGKTTLTNMIARFFIPTKGDIKLDGNNISKIKLVSLREQLALVSQEIVLFNDTIKANVAYGSCSKATDEEIKDALITANAWDFVQNLKNKLDENIGDGGNKLSGGQKQRIVLARAFLKNAPILILDEASSALDNRTEKLVQNAIKRIAKDRTTIIIAHRLSTIKHADRIIVLDKGNIVEEGKHEDLINTNGTYAKLYLSMG